MDIDWTFRRGDVVKIRLVNQRRSFHGMQHPIHIHGQRFLVLAVNDASEHESRVEGHGAAARRRDGRHLARSIEPRTLDATLSSRSTCRRT
jgi:FtsP/CotA-like multicopper oxidase with cupredoxin domain